MSEKTRKTLVFATLLLAVVWALFNLPSSEPPPAVIEPAVQIAPEIAAMVATPSSPGLIDVEERAKLPWGADPFRSNLVTSRETYVVPLPREWNLKGIVYTEENPLAFINRQSVRVGDVVNEGEVVAINKNTVIIRYRDQEITLAVNKG